jgi:curved DNA-binding protein
MDYYTSLGIEKNASSDDIQKAFRKLAMKHHPDKGGDSSKFQEINEAYSTLSDPQKRAEYDMGSQNPFGRTGSPFQNGFSFHTGNPFQGGGGNPFNDVFNQFGFQFHTGQNIQRNRDLNIRCRISLMDSYLGKQMNVSYRLPSGQDESVTIDIPPGIEPGQIIKLSGYGDNSIRQLPRGDLTIVFEVEPMAKFHREDLTLVTSTDIDIFDAMIGTKVNVENIDGTMVDLTIPAGCLHGQRLSCKGMGFKSMKFNNVKGDLHVVVNVKTPAIRDPALIKEIQDLANKIKNR